VNNPLFDTSYPEVISNLLATAQADMHDKLVAAAHQGRVAVQPVSVSMDPALATNDTQITFCVKTIKVDDCPECVQGKHVNCDHTTWSTILDSLVGCPCAVRGHEPRNDHGADT
jgi:hypothetical protein